MSVSLYSERVKRAAFTLAPKQTHHVERAGARLNSVHAFPGLRRNVKRAKRQVEISAATTKNLFAKLHCGASLVSSDLLVHASFLTSGLGSVIVMQASGTLACPPNLCSHGLAALVRSVSLSFFRVRLSLSLSLALALSLSLSLSHSLTLSLCFCLLTAASPTLFRWKHSFGTLAPAKRKGVEPGVLFKLFKCIDVCTSHARTDATL